MAIFSISHSESGKKLLTLKSPVNLSHIDTYECTSADEIATIMTQAKVAQSEWKKTTLGGIHFASLHFSCIIYWYLSLPALDIDDKGSYGKG